MTGDEILARLAEFTGTDDDATEAFQAALDFGYCAIRGSYRVRFPLVVGGAEYDREQCGRLLTATLRAV